MQNVCLSKKNLARIKYTTITCLIRVKYGYTFEQCESRLYDYFSELKYVIRKASVLPSKNSNTKTRQLMMFRETMAHFCVKQIKLINKQVG
jgi:hypothetical protein